MKLMLSLFVLVAFFGAPVHAADGVSGTWMTTSESNVQTFIFKVRQDTITGLTCGPCDSPASVFKIEDGRVLDGNRVTFFIRYDRNGPLFDKYGPYRERVDATLSADQLTLRVQPEKGGGSPVTTVLRRVVENGVSMAKKTWTLATSNPPVAQSSSSLLDGKWVANGRVAQQNFVLKVQDNKLWGLVCGPCNADGVFLIDDGTIEGDRVTFYINHIDTPPSPQPGLRRNIMRGTILGNVMKFRWVREGAEDQPGGEMVLIGPIR